MKKYFYFLFAIIAVACAEEAEEDSGLVTGTSHMDQETYTETEEAMEGLELNGGNKWRLDSYTADAMNQVKELVVGHEGEEFADLGAELKDLLKDIEKNTGMNGEDLEQFEIIRSAMFKESKELKKGKSTDLVKMNRYLEMYEKHFEL